MYQATGCDVLTCADSHTEPTGSWRAIERLSLDSRAAPAAPHNERMRTILIPLLLTSLTATQLPAETLTGNEQNAPTVVKDRAEPETSPDGVDPRRALDAWLVSFNEHDEATREKWLLENTNYTPEQAKQIAGIDQKIRSAMGTFELVRVVRSEGRTIEVEARHSGNGVLARLEITLDEAKPAKIADVKLQKAENQDAEDGSA